MTQEIFHVEFNYESLEGKLARVSADHDAWKARAEKAEAELKEAVECIEKIYQYMKSGMLPMAKKELSRYIANKEDGKDG